PTVIAAQADDPAIATGLTPPEALAIDSVALLPPAPVGRKPTATEVDPPPPSVRISGTPTLNSLACGPVIWNGVDSVTGAAGSSFTIVTELVADAPMSSDPKSIDEGVTLIPGVAVPTSATAGAPPGLAITALADLPPAADR